MCVGLSTSDTPNVLNGFSRNRIPNPEEEKCLQHKKGLCQLGFVLFCLFLLLCQLETR